MKFFELKPGIFFKIKEYKYVMLTQTAALCLPTDLVAEFAAEVCECSHSLEATINILTDKFNSIKLKNKYELDIKNAIIYHQEYTDPNERL